MVILCVSLSVLLEGHIFSLLVDLSSGQGKETSVHCAVYPDSKRLGVGYQLLVP